MLLVMLRRMSSKFVQNVRYLNFSGVLRPRRRNSSNTIAMFNRIKEKEVLYNFLFSRYPGVMIITGSQDSGKTRLIEKMRQQTRDAGHFQWLHMNMREPVHHWTSAEAACRSLLHIFASAFSQYQMTTTAFSKELQWRFPFSAHSGGSLGNLSGHSFVEVLSAVESMMMWSLSHGECYPVLSIDDAERIYTYLGKDNYPEGKMILEILINFLATTPIHVVVSSTNVHHFLEHMHNRAEIMVIGDLVRDDAQQFWEEYLPKTYPSIPSPPFSFGDVFAVLGGHMYHLEQCYFRGIPPELTSIVKIALVSWKQFLVPISGSKKWKWSRNASLAIMKELYYEGSIQYSAMRDEIGEEAIDEMIKCHFLVYQPLPAVVNTGMEDPTRYPILNAPTPAHLWTLRKYFKF